MPKRTSLFLLLLIFSFITVLAQKSEISLARSYIRSGSDLDKAEASMRTLLNDSVNRSNIKIYVTLADAVRKQYDAANEKMYLKDNADTASFFSLSRNMFMTYEALDSVDATPNIKGVAKPKYRKKNAAFLNKYRNNLYRGGVFFMKKSDFEQAFQMLDTYVNCVRQPMFTDYNYKFSDSLCLSAAFWTMVCGYKLNNSDYALKYKNLILDNDSYRKKALRYLVEIYLQKEDTLSYVRILHKGFDMDKTSKFYFTRLVDYYNNNDKLDSALYIINSALAADPNNALFLAAKSSVLLNMGRYLDCIDASDKALAIDDDLPDVYFNAGISYFNLALLLEDDAKNYMANHEQILNYNRLALPYMEKYRQLCPTQRKKWVPSLYHIYYNLNMGPQFEEICKVVAELKQEAAK
ncbi:MAG: hypothetical protein LUC91_11530 [Prevotella sp.]|nr:hypothetical protein [Prevotella sp.]